MTKVCHISTVHDPLDVRVFFKECLSLSKHFDVSLVIKQNEKSAVDRVNLIPIKPFKNKVLRVLFSPFTAFAKARLTKASIYHLHDPELLIIAPLFRLFGDKVIFDKHENVAGQILSKHWLGPQFVRKAVSKIYEILERFFIGFCNGVVVVIPEMQEEKGMKNAVLVRNFPSKEAFGNEVKIREGKLKFVYAGGLTPIRGIKETIDAFVSSEVDAELYLVGKWSSEKFQRECMDELGNGRVIYKGFIPMQEVYELYRRTHIGLCLLHPTENYKWSLPVKVFEYYFAGMHVLMSNIEYWKNEFSDRADYADPFSHEELVGTFKRLESEYKVTGKFEDRSEWAKQNYSWESEFEKLLALYNSLLNSEQIEN
ncbi:MAG: glycosyltransferase [Flavobacteriales bacterium]|nr:glycosyltransferase [Flavobacteriales bacterium]